MLLPSDEVEREPEEGDHPQQVGPDVSRLSVNAKDRLETFPERRKCSYKFLRYCTCVLSAPLLSPIRTTFSKTMPRCFLRT
jgi:hypothetical protein